MIKRKTFEYGKRARATSNESEARRKAVTKHRSRSMTNRRAAEKGSGERAKRTTGKCNNLNKSACLQLKNFSNYKNSIKHCNCNYTQKNIYTLYGIVWILYEFFFRVCVLLLALILASLSPSLLIFDSVRVGSVCPCPCPSHH